MLECVLPEKRKPVTIAGDSNKKNKISNSLPQKRKSPVKKPKNDDQAPTLLEKIKTGSSRILTNAPVTTQDILSTGQKKKKRRVDPPRPATDIAVLDVLRDAWRKWLIITIATTVVPYEKYTDFQKPYKKKEAALIDKYVQQMKDDRENEVVVQELKTKLVKYKEEHGIVNVPQDDEELGNIINNIRNQFHHIVNNPKFFDWLLDKGFIMAFFAGRTPKKDEKRHLEKIDEVRAKQRQATEAFETQQYIKASLCKQFPILKEELAALKEECQRGFHDYIKKCKIACKKGHHPIYGIPVPLKRNIYGDASLVHFNTTSTNPDERGERVTLDIERWIQPDGGIYTLKKNGKKGKITYGSKEHSSVKINRTLPSEATVPIYLLVLFSYFPHLNWKPFCRAAGKKRKAESSAEIDHILQVHEKCHFAYLEAVPGSENTYRNKFSATHSTQREKSGKTQGKPFHIFHGGIEIFTASTAQEGVTFLKERFPEKFQAMKEHSLVIKLSAALHQESRYCELEKKYFLDRGIILVYTQEYLNSQKYLLDEVWRYNLTQTDKHPKDVLTLTWKQPNDPHLKDCKLLAISNKGRIMFTDGEIKDGSINHEKHEPVVLEDELRAKRKRAPTKIHSLYNGKGIHTLVWPAFKEEKRGDRMVLHENGDEFLRTNKDGKKINVYTNELASLYLGDAAQNNRDRVVDEIDWARRIPANEACFYDPAGCLIQETFFSVQEFCQERDFTYNSDLLQVWDGKSTHSHGYTLEFVIPRPDRPPCVRVGKEMIDKKTKNQCVIKKLKDGGGVEIEFCDGKKIVSRRNSVTNPAFEDVSVDELSCHPD